MPELSSSTANSPSGPQGSRPCPVCDGRDSRLWRQITLVLPQNHPLQNGYALAVCNGCGMVFADTPASQKVYDRYYEQLSKYQDQTTSTGGGGTPQDKARLQGTAARLAKLFPDRASRILDIGCGNGGLLNALQELGYKELQGIDPSPRCAANTRSRGIPAVEGVLGGAWTLARCEFDVLTLSHVLEHVRDVRSALDSLPPLLTPRGCVYIEVPDALRYADFLQAPFQEFNTEHINHFSETSLKSLARHRGWEIVESGASVLFEGTPRAYPVCFAVLRPAAAGQASQIPADHELLSSLTRYARCSEAHWDRIKAFLDDALKPDQPVIIWGTGQLTFKLLADTRLSATPIAGFVDGNPVNWGQTLRGRTILPPEDFGSLPEAPILIATLLHQEPIVTQIHRLRGSSVRLISLPRADRTPKR